MGKVNTADRDFFVALVRAGVSHPLPEGFAMPAEVEWKAAFRIARRQALSAVAYDGVDALAGMGLISQSQRMEDKLRFRWIASVIRNFDQKYEDYRARIGELAGFYNSRGFRMMVLKGYGLSLNWPRPSHRPCGDIDIWQFGQYRETDAALSREKGIAIDNSHHHHTVFDFGEYAVENHYDLVNVHANRSNAAIEKILKSLAMDDSFYTEIDGERVWLPSPDLNALFLLRHTMLHFSAEGITLRHLLDWGFFVEKHASEVDAALFREVTGKYYMTRFASCLSTLCVKVLGFDPAPFARLLPSATDPALPLMVDDDLLSKIMDDIFNPEFDSHLPDALVPRVIMKFKRWAAYGWKRRLCYREGPVSSFIIRAWAHILKPSSI